MVRVELCPVRMQHTARRLKQGGNIITTTTTTRRTESREARSRKGNSFDEAGPALLSVVGCAHARADDDIEIVSARARLFSYWSAHWAQYNRVLAGFAQ
jgi:hypothetical protein